MDKELLQMREMFAKVQKEYWFSKGYIDSATSNKVPTEQQYQNDRMCAMIDHLHSRINHLEDKHYEHNSPSKHLPPFRTASQLEGALKKLGLENDYEVVKPKIYAGKNGASITVEAEYEKA